MGPRPVVLAALLVCAVSVRAQSESEPRRAVPHPDTIPPTTTTQGGVEATARSRPGRTDSHSEADLTKLLTTLVDGQLALSDYMKEAFATLQQEVQRASVFGQRCRSDSDCSDLRAGTVCSSAGRCECGEGLQHLAGGACRPYPRLSEPCRQNTDCQGATEHSMCSDNVCVCEEGYVNDNTVCRRPLLSEPCAWPIQCLQNYSTCRDSKCVCIDHYWNDRDAVCRPYPMIREACNTTRECQGRSEYSVCEDGVCTCVDGYLPRWSIYSPSGDVMYVECDKAASYGQNCFHPAACGTTAEMVLSGTAKMLCVHDRCSCWNRVTIFTGRSLFGARLHGDSGYEGGFVRDDDSGKLLCDADWTEADADWTQADADWTEADADVLCRSLRFSGGRPGEAPAPPDDYQCIGYRMACTGTERRAADCRWSLTSSRDAMAPVWVNCYTE